MWGQLLVGVWSIVRIVVQYALRRATNLSEVLLRHKKKEKKDAFLNVRGFKCQKLFPLIVSTQALTVSR